MHWDLVQPIHYVHWEGKWTQGPTSNKEDICNWCLKGKSVFSKGASLGPMKCTLQGRLMLKSSWPTQNKLRGFSVDFYFFFHSFILSFFLLCFLFLSFWSFACLIFILWGFFWKRNTFGWVSSEENIWNELGRGKHNQNILYSKINKKCILKTNKIKVIFIFFQEKLAIC